MIGKGAVDLWEQHPVLAFKPADKPFCYWAAGTIAAIPDDGQSRRPGTCGKPVNIGWLNVLVPHHATAAPGHAGAACRAKRQNIVAKERMSAHHHLEAVMGWRVMASRHLNGTTCIELMRGEIQHWGGTATDIYHLGATCLQTIDQHRGKCW